MDSEDVMGGTAMSGEYVMAKASDVNNPAKRYVDCLDGGSVPVARMKDGTIYLGMWSPLTAAERMAVSP